MVDRSQQGQLYTLQQQYHRNTGVLYIEGGSSLPTKHPPSDLQGLSRPNSETPGTSAIGQPYEDASHGLKHNCII